MKRSSLRPVSKKRAKTLKARRELVERLRNGPCAARLPMCTGRAQDGHELLSRANGGSITDPENVVGLCRMCHDYITTNPEFAYEKGWAFHAWEKP